MRRRLWSFAPLAVALTLVGCNFKPASGSPTGAGGAGGGAASGGSPQTGSGGSTTNGSGGSPGTGGTTSSTGGIGMTGDIGGGGKSCGQTNVSIKPVPPDILVVEDRSGSMQDATDPNCNGAACSKWSQVGAAIDKVVQATDTKVNWGLAFFPTDSTCGVTQTPIVPVAPMSGQPIQTAFAGTQPNGKTPTASAVNDAVAYLQTLTDPNPKFLLLATDGLPNCGANAGLGGNGGGMIGGGGVMPDDSPNAEAAVSAAKTAGFPTFVVGISTSSDAMANATLNTLATNGGYPQAGAATQYYSVTDTTSLETALNKIIGMTLSCTIPLGNKPDNLSNVAVSAQDAQGKRIEVPQDPTNGWSLDATNSTIILNGSACADLQSVTLTEYQFIFACADVKICIDSCPGQQ